MANGVTGKRIGSAQLLPFLLLVLGLSWSLTMYDGKTQLFIDNPLDRYLLSSEMMEEFETEEDGSLVLHIGKDSPGQGLEPNWLPAPDGPFYMVLRLYGPEQAALEGRWAPPAAERAK